MYMRIHNKTDDCRRFLKSLSAYIISMCVMSRYIIKQLNVEAFVPLHIQYYVCSVEIHSFIYYLYA